MIQNPSQVRDRRGGDGSEDSIKRRRIIQDKPLERLGSRGLEITCPNDGEASDIAGALLENRAPVGLEDRVVVRAAGPDRVLVRIDDSEVGGACEFFGDHCERIVGQQISGIENADAVVAGEFFGQRGPLLPGKITPRRGSRPARSRQAARVAACVRSAMTASSDHRG
jgi:hypothetical protein